MGAADWILPFLGFAVLITPLFLDSNERIYKKIAIAITGVIILGFSWWKAWSDNEALQSVKDDNSSILSILKQSVSDRVTDSTNAANFQKVLLDSLGISKLHGKPIVTNNRVFKSYISNYLNQFIPENEPDVKSNITPAGPGAIPDSLNFYYSLRNGFLTISPKEGAWTHSFIIIDSSDFVKNQMTTEGENINADEYIMVDGMRHKVITNQINNRAVYKESPISINIMNTPKFLIFGETGNNSKRYLYRDSKIYWYPKGFNTWYEKYKRHSN